MNQKSHLSLSEQNYGRPAGVWFLKPYIEYRNGKQEDKDGVRATAKAKAKDDIRELMSKVETHKLSAKQCKELTTKIEEETEKLRDTAEKDGSRQPIANLVKYLESLIDDYILKLKSEAQGSKPQK